MKILSLVSCLDLSFRYGCTPCWWQLLKALYSGGIDVIATTYQGRAIQSPWWRTYENPCLTEGVGFGRFKSLIKNELLVRKLAQSFIRPKWIKHVRNIINKEKDIEAIIIFNIPLNHITGLASIIKNEFSIPVYYFDGDLPESLPKHKGFSSGFSIYPGADLTEYDGFMVNSEGAIPELKALGAKRVQAVHWGIDPEFFEPVPMDEDIDLFFYGFGEEYREEWIDNMILKPKNKLKDAHFVLGGKNFRKELDGTERIENIPYNLLKFYHLRSKINLNITRELHRTVYASSSARIFEMAALGKVIVSNPYEGMEQWFIPGKEILMVHSAEEAIRTYQELLSKPEMRKEIGEKARARVLDQHTYNHRVKELLEFIQ